MKEEEEDWVETAEKLYYHTNPNTSMDVPSSVYEQVERWRIEWFSVDTELSLFDWCIQTKNK